MVDNHKALPESLITNQGPLNGSYETHWPFNAENTTRRAGRLTASRANFLVSRFVLRNDTRGRIFRVAIVGGVLVSLQSVRTRVWIDTNWTWTDMTITQQRRCWYFLRCVELTRTACKNQYKSHHVINWQRVTHVSPKLTNFAHAVNMNLWIYGEIRTNILQVQLRRCCLAKNSETAVIISQFY